MREAPSAVGIYDRDYYRQEQRLGPSLHAPRTVVGAIIAVNVAVWIADFFTPATAIARKAPSSAVGSAIRWPSTWTRSPSRGFGGSI